MANIRALLDYYKKIEDERFFSDVFEKGEYSAVKAMKTDVVIDVGACAGEFSAYIYDQAKEIYALEPYSEHYAELDYNVREFGLDKVKPFRLALAGDNGLRNLTINNRGGHTLGDGHKSEPVPALTLATFIKEQKIKRVDLLKIDVENSEDEIFKAPDFGEVAPIIQVIIGEHLAASHDLFMSLGFNQRTDGDNSIYERKNHD